eukprot:TRINITY_DN12494_c0_g1_i3.p1 TRINITY_DN12494_c0_g1~~TRINITY_DN12494_c0_g1_i3.p1  ORF type:complete len:286 (+),score=68.71 TRINITY_DN12494_c0_g1_i3:273-1130(+)
MATYICGSVVSRRGATFAFSYGFDRLATLLWFANSVLLCFITMFIGEGVAERFFEGADDHHSAAASPTFGDPDGIGLSTAAAAASAAAAVSSSHHGDFTGTGVAIISIISLVYNIASVTLFNNVLHYGTVSVQDRFKSLATSAAATSILSLLTGWMSTSVYGQTVDTLCAIAVAVMLVLTAIPVFQGTARLLLQTTPALLKGRLDKCCREASAFEGILECTQEHYWELSPGVVIGSVHFRLRADANEQAILQHVTRCFSTSPSLLAKLTVHLQKDDDWPGTNHKH